MARQQEEEAMDTPITAQDQLRPWIASYPEGIDWQADIDVTPVHEQVLAACARNPSATALDFLGFGLPPPTPSWGEVLSQAQEYPWAWWLTLYPASALFLVMLAGVFIGEGVRQAFDPKPYSRME